MTGGSAFGGAGDDAGTVDFRGADAEEVKDVEGVDEDVDEDPAGTNNAATSTPSAAANFSIASKEGLAPPRSTRLM